MIILNIYLLIGFIEYFRYSKEFRQQLQEDYPFHPSIFIDIALIIVLILCGPPLLIFKIFSYIKDFLYKIYKKVTFPFRLLIFRSKLKKMSKEKDNKKAVEMLFDAMRDVLK